MSKDVYLEGYQLGRVHANKSKAPIFASKSSKELGVLAGSKLDACRSDPHSLIDNTFVKTESFGSGYFDGFLDRAAEILEKAGPK